MTAGPVAPVSAPWRSQRTAAVLCFSHLEPNANAMHLAVSGATVLELHNISKRFGKLLANDDISLSLRQGELLALLGENGAGKTTLMNILFGHYTADFGKRFRLRRGIAARQSKRSHRRRHRHGASAFRARREPDRARQHHPGHRTVESADDRPCLGPGQDCGPVREIRPQGRSRREGGRFIDRRAAAGRNSQAALPQGQNPHPRRADRGSNADRVRATVRHPAIDGARAIVADLHFAQAGRGAARGRPHRCTAWGQADSGAPAGQDQPGRVGRADGWAPHRAAPPRAAATRPNRP